MVTMKRSLKTRNYFHVLPVAAGWVVKVDRRTALRLDVGDLELSRWATKVVAIRAARVCAIQYKPSELLIHRRPKAGEKKNVFPIVDRRTYGDDPKKSKG